MPLNRLRRAHLVAGRPASTARALLFAAAAACAVPTTGAAQTEGVQTVRSRHVELAYRLQDSPLNTEVELWYTRDRGATWQKWGIHTDPKRPILFGAPAEGLYGFVLILVENGKAPAAPPDSHTPVQRWVFIDYTPPLVQWDGVEAAEDFASRRTVHLRWTAHDDNLPARPVALYWQSSIDQTWQTIDAALPNAGQCDWTIPAQVAGQITLKIAVRDLGGHVVERLYGPVSVDRWVATGIALDPLTTKPSDLTATKAATRPAGFATTRPALMIGPNGEFARMAPKLISAYARQQTEKLWAQGNWHAQRQEYGVARERLREALDLDPTFVPALYDLGAVHYYQRDYGKAVEMFKSVLAQDAKHRLALRGMHESFIAEKRYDQSYDVLQKLLKLNDGDSQSWLDLGDVLFMMGDQNGAREKWTRAMTADPSAGRVIESARARLKLKTDALLAGRQAPTAQLRR